MNSPRLVAFWLFLSAIAGACSAQRQVQDPSTQGGSGSASAMPPPVSSAQRAREPLGASLDAAVKRCGPQDSYHFLIREFQCPLGPNPLAGNPDAAKTARRGSLRDPRSDHQVDVYLIPCQPTPVRVYVDMYACAEYEAKLKQPESELARLVRTDFAAGRFHRVVGRCGPLLQRQLGDAGARCLTLMPAALHLQGKRRAAAGQMEKTCAAFPPPSSDSNVRAMLVLETLGAIAEGAKRGRVRMDERQIAQTLVMFMELCEVPEEQIEQLLKPPQRA